MFLWVVFSNCPLNNTLALALFMAASVTDLFDGRIARKRGLITNFGILMDPLADKVLTCSAFIALVERHMNAKLAGQLPAVFFLGQHPVYPKVEAWMVVLIVARELAITGLRLLAASKNLVLAAEGYGKHKTTTQMVAIISLLTLNALPEWGPWLQALFNPWAPAFAFGALWLAVVLTALSGIIYLWRNRGIYLNDL